MTVPTSVLVVDAANVVGARADGWWRDRPGAARRLLSTLAAAAELGSALAEIGERRIVVVLEGQAVTAAPDGWVGFDVVLAARDGDAAIVDVVARLSGEDVLVVTSDRELRRRVEELGARVRGAGWLRKTLDDVGA